MVCHMSHTHIRKEDWPVIARMLRAGYAGAEIARTIGKDPSPVNRRINQYGVDGVKYDARYANKSEWGRIDVMDGTSVLFKVLRCQSNTRTKISPSANSTYAAFASAHEPQFIYLTPCTVTSIG